MKLLRRLWYRLFGHPLKGYQIILHNGTAIGTVQSVTHGTITFKPAPEGKEISTKG